MFALNVVWKSEVLIPRYAEQSQPDQAIHLAAAMLFAGFKSVIATMWLVIMMCLSLGHECGSPEVTLGPWRMRMVR
jgi:hypothetical protein